MKRLFDDPALPSELRNELLRSRSAGQDYDVLAKLPKLHEALHRAHATADGSSLEHEPSPLLNRLGAARVRGVATAWKLALLIAAVGSVVYTLWPSHPPAARSKPSPQPSAPIAPAPPLGRVPESEAAAPLPQADERVAPRPAQRPSPGAGSSRREIAQLVRIRALLEKDPAAAYRLAQRSEQEFPHGVLSEERRALQVVALAKSGAAEAAQHKAHEFLARYPQSPLRELVEAALHR